MLRSISLTIRLGVRVSNFTWTSLFFGFWGRAAVFTEWLNKPTERKRHTATLVQRTFCIVDLLANAVGAQESVMENPSTHRTGARNSSIHVSCDEKRR